MSDLLKLVLIVRSPKKTLRIYASHPNPKLHIRNIPITMYEYVNAVYVGPKFLSHMFDNESIDVTKGSRMNMYQKITVYIAITIDATPCTNLLITTHLSSDNVVSCSFVICTIISEEYDDSDI